MTRDEWRYALDLGRRRELENNALRLQHAHNYRGDDGMAMHKAGALVEVATAKGLDIPYVETKRRDPDLLGDIQVRGADSHSKRLILHEPEDENGKGDPPHHRYIFTTRRGKSPDFYIQGWLFYGEGARREFWADPTGKNRPAYFVDSELLRRIDTLYVPRGLRFSLPTIRAI